MPLILLESDSVRLTLNPALGAGVARLDLSGPDGDWTPLWRPVTEPITSFNDLACYTLAPWSNRIENARFEWQGECHELLADWPDGTAIHGCVKDRPWRILDRSPISARFGYDAALDPSPGFPFPFKVTARYEIEGPRLAIDLDLTNTDSARTMPAGLGLHPYFQRRLWNDEDDVRLTLPVRSRYAAPRMLPLSPPDDDAICTALRLGTRLSGVLLDDCFLGSLDGARIDYPASGITVRLGASPAFTHTVLYTGRGMPEQPPFFCLEPVTMANNGFNLAGRGWHDGVIPLAPGERMHARFTLDVERRMR
ncbi:MAG: hypothetical protein IT439_10870 [Phycisphaerales bacterium]|nr:hypothetical protein [Phycisphaerales bacterium]